MKQIRWGILATGTIAKKFAATLQQLPDCGIPAAVASRSLETAQAFAAEHGMNKAYGSYAELAADPDIDIIYVATPHSQHFENVKLCLELGKPVLCEKSFTVNAAQAEELFALAKEKRLFLMEAFWTSFLPAYERLAEIIAAGAIGDILHLRAQYGFSPAGARHKRKMDPALAGGALLDIGVYALGVTVMLLGPRPKRLVTSAVLGEYGTDAFNSMMLTYDNGVSAHLITAIGTVLEQQAAIYGTKGHIILPAFSALQEFTLVTADGAQSTVQLPFEVNGFEYQIREAERCLLTGKTESAVRRPEDTLAVLRLMDEARQEWGMPF